MCQCTLHALARFWKVRACASCVRARAAHDSARNPASRSVQSAYATPPWASTIRSILVCQRTTTRARRKRVPRPGKWPGAHKPSRTRCDPVHATSLTRAQVLEAIADVQCDFHGTNYSPEILARAKFAPVRLAARPGIDSSKRTGRLNMTCARIVVELDDRLHVSHT